MLKANLSMPRASRLRNTTAAVRRAVPGDRLTMFGVYVCAAYLFLKMFYVFNEGTAQPADILLAMSAFVVCSPYLFLDFLKQNIAFVMMIVWIMLVNVAWFMLTANIGIAYFVMFYFFNALIVISVYSVRLRNPDIFDRYIIMALRVSFIVQVLFVLRDTYSRALGSFSSPNQLAYWGVVSLSIYLILTRSRFRLLDLFFILLATYCVICSLSRAGLIANLLLLVTWVGIFANTWHKRVLVGAFTMVFGSLLIMTGTVDRYLAKSSLVATFESRVSSKTDNNLGEGRNYDRILDYYQYTVFGAGEGYYGRFVPSHVLAIEIHSSFATMLFSYGVIGLMLFIGFLASIVRRVPLTVSLYLLPSLFYSLTHQGLRFAFFWIMIGIMLSIGETVRKERARTAPASKRALRRWQPRSREFLLARARGETKRIE